MLIALLSDIHGNREALEAVLHDATRRGADRFVILGDLVGYGADPGFVVDTVARMADEGAVVLRGNHDEAISRSEADMNPVAQAALRWTRAQLDPAQRAFLSGLPLTHEEDDRLYVHASAFQPPEWHYILDVDEAAASLAATASRVTFCGHVHVPALYRELRRGSVEEIAPAAEQRVALRQASRWLAVLGAVGQPRDGDPAAAFSVLDDATGILTFARVVYDASTAARKIVAAGLPARLASRLLVGQ